MNLLETDTNSTEINYEGDNIMNDLATLLKNDVKNLLTSRGFDLLERGYGKEKRNTPYFTKRTSRSPRSMPRLPLVRFHISLVTPSAMTGSGKAITKVISTFKDRDERDKAYEFLKTQPQYRDFFR